MERWVQTCRHELLDRTLIWNQRHLLHALREFEQFYNSHRPHQGIANARPLHPLPAPTTDPDQIASLDIRKARATRWHPQRVPTRCMTCPDEILGKGKASRSSTVGPHDASTTGYPRAPTRATRPTTASPGAGFRPGRMTFSSAVPRITLHDLRHLAATLTLTAGVPLAIECLAATSGPSSAPRPDRISTLLSPHLIFSHDNPATLSKLPNPHHFAIQYVIKCKFPKFRCIVSVFYRRQHLVSQSSSRLKKLIDYISHPLRRKRKFTAPAPLQGRTRFPGAPLAVQSRLPDRGLINVQDITIGHNEPSSCNGGVRTRGTRHPASIREPLKVVDFALIQRRLNRHRPNEVRELTHTISPFDDRGSHQQ